MSDLVTRQGINGFFDSTEARSACCNVRKVVPFKKFVDGYTAWITGVRREQSKSRSEGQAVEWDAQNWSAQTQPAARLVGGTGLGVHPRPPAALQQPA